MFSKLLSSNDNDKLNSWIKNKDKPLFSPDTMGVVKPIGLMNF